MIENNDILLLCIASMAFGLYALIKGGNWTTDAAVFIANRFNISPLLIGFTVVAFGTSLPELIVSINANLNGVSDIALGSVIGSNITNILLIAGLTATLHTLHIHSQALKAQIILMIGATALLTILIYYGLIARWHGALMFLSLIIFVVWSYRTEQKKKTSKNQENTSTFSNSLKMSFFLIAGLFFLWIGSEALIKGTVITARLLHIPESLISLSLIALGTSLPELSAAIAASVKKQGDMIVGNIIGSNVFNILSVIGLTSLTRSIYVDTNLFLFNTTVTLGITSLFGIWIMNMNRINRFLGIGFLLCYFVYILYLAGSGFLISI